MICTGNPVVFFPFGRNFLQTATSTEKLTDFFRDIRKHRFGNNNTLVGDVPPFDKPVEKYEFRKKRTASLVSSEYFEELYTCGNMGVLSRNETMLTKSYFFDFFVQNALWCRFPCDQSNSCSKLTPTICFIGKQNLEVFLDDGEQISLSLPFEVIRSFETQHGLLLERFAPYSETRSSIITEEDSSFPFIFSLSHPLNEVLPVIYKPIDKFGGLLPSRYTTNQALSIVNCDLEHSIVLCYDSKLNCHSLWLIKKATNEDALSAAKFLEQSVTSALNSTTGKTPSIIRSNRALLTLCRDTPSVSRVGTNSTSGRQISEQQTTSSSTSNMLSLPSAFGSSSQSSEFLPLAMSPIVGLSPLASTKFGQTPRTLVKNSNNKFASPAVSRLMGLIRQKTPTMYSSPLPSVASSSFRATPKNYKQRMSPFLNGSTAPDITSFECSQYWPAEPLIPDICLHHLWTENVACKRNDLLVASKTSASKSFVVVDFVGQKFFCYFLFELQQLRCIRLKDDQGSLQIVQSTPEVIICKDATVTMETQLTVVLDINYTIILYTGVTKICYVHINSSDIAFARQHDIANGDEFAQGNSRIFHSSRAPSVNNTPMKRTVDVENVSLSPVVSESFLQSGDTPMNIGESTSNANGALLVSGVDLFESSSNYFILRFFSDVEYKVSLPPLYQNPIVRLCLNSLRTVLPKEKSMNIFCQWYLTANSPLSKDEHYSPVLWFSKFLADLIGFPTNKMKMFESLRDSSASPTMSTKKARCAEEGTDSDWEYLIQRQVNSNILSFSLPEMANIKKLAPESTPSCENGYLFKVDSSGLLFSSSPSVFWVLHCCYEDLKLQRHCDRKELNVLCHLLHEIATTLKLSSYVDLYERDCSQLIGSIPETFIEESDFKKVQYPFYWNSRAWLIFDQLRLFFDLDDVSSSPTFVLSTCLRIWLVYVVYGLFVGIVKCARDLDSLIKNVGILGDYQLKILAVLDRTDITSFEKMREIFRYEDLKDDGVNVTSLPCGALLPLLESGEILPMAPRSSTKSRPNWLKPKSEKSTTNSGNGDIDDGMSEVIDDDLLKMRFAQDLRIVDVRRMLRSSKHVKIALKQQQGTSDHDFREEQEQFLYSICLRTMMLPIGRGMFTFRSCRQLLTEHVRVPKLCLTGKSTTHSLTVEMTHIETPPNMDLWPQFHNGVASALRIQPSDESRFDSAWIISNVPKASTAGGALSPENAGFLFGLGLNGHLANLALFNIHEYLVKGDTMTSIAVLLGISAAKCRSNDVMVMKMLATHVPFLLPPTLLELNVDPQIQNAAVVSVGLLCAESGNHRLAEALLHEIGRPPTSQTDNFVDRESYALSCGFALGFVTLGRGNLLFGDPDFTLADELVLLMNGGHKRPHHFASSAAPSNVIKEGEFLNVHVTSMPATVALGLTFLKTNDKHAATWLQSPDTLTLLDNVRPDFLLIRVLCRNLILWDDIAPSVDWVERQIPTVLQKYSSLIGSQNSFLHRDVDFESVSQSYCYIIAGACASVGFRFAGSANAEAFAVLIHYCKIFLNSNSQSGSLSIFGELLKKSGKYTVEACLNVIVLSLGMVMTSTGNLDVLRIVRHLRKRLNVGANFLAPHMTLGLLFLGCGRYGLKTDNLSIASMLCAFFPKFPINSNDNRYHLQALRHLYVLASEPRVIIPRDISTDEIAYCSIRIYFKKTKNYPSTSIVLKAPCVLPEIPLLHKVAFEDERYWPITYFEAQNWSDLKKNLVEGGCFYIRKHAGFNSYKDDPLGYQSMVSNNFAKYIGVWHVEQKETLNAEHFNKHCSLHNFCVRHECLDAYPLLIDLYERLTSPDLTTTDVWQLKITMQYLKYRKRISSPSSVSRCILSDEFVLNLSSTLEEKLVKEISPNELKLYIGKWVSNVEDDCKNYLGEFLTYFDVSATDVWSELQLRDYRSLRSFIEKLNCSKMALNSIITIQRILTR